MVLLVFCGKLCKVSDSYLDACYFLCYLDQSIYICNLSQILSFKAEQDEDLEKLEETITSTKHIALAVNEKLNLHTRLLVASFTDVFSIFFFLFPDVHHPICAYDFCSFISLCFTSFAICRITWTSMWTQRIPTYRLLHFYYCTLIYLESICMAVFTLFFDKASNILIL